MKGEIKRFEAHSGPSGTGNTVSGGDLTTPANDVARCVMVPVTRFELTTSECQRPRECW